MRSIIAALTLALACPLLAGPGYQIVDVDQPAAPPAGDGPTLSSAAIDDSGSYLTLTWSDAVSVGAGGASGLAVTLNSGTTTVGSLLSGDGTTTHVFELTYPVFPAATVATIAYTQPGNGLEATTGGDDVSTFSGETVTNASGVRTYINLEGDGYNIVGEGSITENIGTDGVVDEDYTTTVINGLQSLFLNENTGGDVSVVLDLGSGHNTLGVRLRFRIDTGAGGVASAQTVVAFADAGGTDRAQTRHSWAETTTDSAFYARIATTDGAAATDRMDGQTNNVVWMDYSNVSDVVNSYWNDSLLKPAASSSRHSSVTASVTATVQRVVLRQINANMTTIYDDIVLYTPAP